MLLRMGNKFINLGRSVTRINPGIPDASSTNGFFMEMTAPVLFLIFVTFSPILAIPGSPSPSPSASPSTWTPEPCALLTEDSLLCKSIHFTNATAQNFKNILLSDLDSTSIQRIQSVDIVDSLVPTLNLSEFGVFPSLTHLSVNGGQVKNLIGRIAHLPNLQSLNMSFNNLNVLKESVFQIPSSASDSVFTFPRGEGLILDLSHNKLTALPSSVLNLRLKSLSLIGNKFNCAWVMSITSGLYKWYSYGNQNVLYEPDETICQLKEKIFGNNTFLGVLKVKASAIEECAKVHQGCKCDIRSTFALNKIPLVGFPITHQSKYGKVAYSLKADCSNMSLEHFPSISPQVMELNVSFNNISDLSPLKDDPNYANLVVLDASDNQISSLGNLPDSPFYDHFQLLNLRGNNITELHINDIAGFFTQHRPSLEGIGLGENPINCDCLSVVKLRPKLIKHEGVIKDWKTIFCQTQNTTLWELKYYDVCHSEEEPPSEIHWYFIIGIEAVVILLVIIKLWCDRREFRRSGLLPLCSTWIPRLPCDYMLEGLKDSHYQQQQHTPLPQHPPMQPPPNGHNKA